jgi:hypothetical protein
MIRLAGVQFGASKLLQNLAFMLLVCCALKKLQPIQKT